jgi:hypothetical protein
METTKGQCIRVSLVGEGLGAVHVLPDIGMLVMQGQAGAIMGAFCNVSASDMLDIVTCEEGGMVALVTEKAAKWTLLDMPSEAAEKAPKQAAGKKAGKAAGAKGGSLVEAPKQAAGKAGKALAIPVDPYEAYDVLKQAGRVPEGGKCGMIRPSDGASCTGPWGKCRSHLKHCTAQREKAAGGK